MTTPSDDDQYIAIETEDSDRGAEEFSRVVEKRALYEENQALKESLSKSDRNFYILLVSLILAILAFVVTISIFAKIPKTQYIATSDNTAICNVSPQDNPNYTNESITTFINQLSMSGCTYECYTILCATFKSFIYLPANPESDVNAVCMFIT